MAAKILSTMLSALVVTVVPATAGSMGPSVAESSSGCQTGDGLPQPCLPGAGGQPASFALPARGDLRTAPSVPLCGLPAATPLERCPSWTSSYNHVSLDRIFDVAWSPDGAVVYGTGVSFSGRHDYDMATVALNAATGGVIWASRFDRIQRGDAGHSIAVSPDGRSVYVTGVWGAWPYGVPGTSFTTASYATVAYDAATGAQKWFASYEGLNQLLDYAMAAVVSPDGERLFVTGYSSVSGGAMDVFTVAYETETGREDWVTRWGREGDDVPAGNDVPTGIVATPDGKHVVIVGQTGLSPFYDPDPLMTGLVVAMDASTGSVEWVRVGDPGDQGWNVAVAADPDSRSVITTGHDGTYALTASYDADSGATLWTARRGEAGEFIHSNDIQATAGSTPQVFVGGVIGNNSWTEAYAIADGSSRWSVIDTEDPLENPFPSITADAKGSRVVHVSVTVPLVEGLLGGMSWRLRGYDGADGTSILDATFNSSERADPDIDYWPVVAMHPDGGSVVAGGTFIDPRTDFAYDFGFASYDLPGG